MNSTLSNQFELYLNTLLYTVKLNGIISQPLLIDSEKMDDDDDDDDRKWGRMIKNGRL